MTASLAPSGANQQPWTFVCISSAAQIANPAPPRQDEEREF